MGQYCDYNTSHKTLSTYKCTTFVWTQHEHSKQCSLHSEHFKRGLVGPEATTKSSIGLDVNAILCLLTDSVGLVCWADDKVVLLSVREESETMVLQANVELLTADNVCIRSLDTRVLQISGYLPLFNTTKVSGPVQNLDLGTGTGFIIMG
ncbi:hypothetical protein ROHU_031258 [Labeo rohita]|uniref:Uncharacterized protein n=1 Tax=Labeo rohita TaxID=84645 RepID=A0A498LNH0_LABRO|nr:hypothetical protein ROHU_031258 [Labeo rohita]